MRRYAPVVAILALVLPVAAADEAAAKKLNGSYQVVSILVGGKPDDKKKDRVSEFTIKDGTITLKESGEKTETATFTVDPTKKPGHFDIFHLGAEAMKGIYEVKETDKGLELTIAFSKSPEDPRPKDFKDLGEEYTVIKLLRKK